MGAKCPVGPHLRERGLKSGILIHPTIFPQEICAEPIWKGGGIWSKSKDNAIRAETDLHVKFHSNPSNRLASVLKTQPDRIGQTGRQTDNRLIAQGKPL